MTMGEEIGCNMWLGSYLVRGKDHSAATMKVEIGWTAAGVHGCDSSQRLLT